MPKAMPGTAVTRASTPAKFPAPFTRATPLPCVCSAVAQGIPAMPSEARAAACAPANRASIAWRSPCGSTPGARQTNPARTNPNRSRAGKRSIGVSGGRFSMAVDIRLARPVAVVMAQPPFLPAGRGVVEILGPLRLDRRHLLEVGDRFQVTRAGLQLGAAGGGEGDLGVQHVELRAGAGCEPFAGEAEGLDRFLHALGLALEGFPRNVQREKGLLHLQLDLVDGVVVADPGFGVLRARLFHEAVGRT